MLTIPVVDTAYAYLNEALKLPEAPLAIMGVVILLCAYLVYLLLKGKRTMTQKEDARPYSPTRWTKMHVEDILQDALDDALLSGKIGPRLRKYVMNEIGSNTSLKGLIPHQRSVVRKLHPYRIKMLKEAIQERLEGAFYKVKPPLPADAMQPVGKKPIKLKLVKKESAEDKRSLLKSLAA